MSGMARIPAHDRLPRELSIEETYTLASLARRKSSSGSPKIHLRQRLGNAQLLEALENAIKNSPPPSPQQPCLKPSKSQHISWTALDTPQRDQKAECDEYGFAYDDDDDEENGLVLVRTQSRSL